MKSFGTHNELSLALRQEVRRESLIDQLMEICLCNQAAARVAKSAMVFVEKATPVTNGHVRNVRNVRLVAVWLFTSVRESFARNDFITA